MSLEYKIKHFFIALKDSFCDRIYIFLYKLTGLCEDKLKKDIENTFKCYIDSQRKVSILEENKDLILGGIGIKTEN